MGKKAPPKGELEENPRKSKSPRLDLLASVAAAVAPETSDLMEVDAAETSGNNRCDHVLTDGDRRRLGVSLLSKKAGTCAGCRREDAEGHRKHRPEESSILMCVECNRHLCCGVGAIEYPFGHSRAHAMKKHHWVAVLYDDAERGYCFNCNAEVEMPVEFEVDGHVIGIDVIRDVVSWLPDTQDRLRARMIVLRTHPQFLGVMEHTWPMLEGTRNKGMCNHIPTDSALKEILSSLMLSDKARKCDNRGCKSSNSHEFGSANMQDYAIRGIPNIANTCYMNASLQCILALDKLRERLLAPDDRGLYALALAELFEETSAAGGLLNPQKIWTCVCLHNDEFVPGRMSDSQELLSSLRDGLNTEEMKIKKLERQIDAPTFINSIFGFKLSQILSCKCGSNSVSHTEFFFELSLPLPLPSPQTSQSLKSRQKNIAVQLFPANEQSNFEKMQTVAESDDSHRGSESKEVIVEATPKPLEVGELICSPAPTQKP